MRLDLLLALSLLVLVGFVLAVAGHNGYWGFLHLAVCLFAAVVILYVSRSRAEYLWLGALGGIALVLTPLTPALTVTGPFWPDVICVAVFVGYYKFCVARGRTPEAGSSQRSDGEHAGRRL
jgi:peptidoglycan/LPS O-acetylase OafA/YrhL